MTAPIAFTFLPNRGMVKPLTAEAFYAKPTDGKLELFASQLHTSVLESTFNEGWVTALNARKTADIRYFAMLHDDVCPEHFWLDKLVEELEKHDADVMSAVMPIRDLHGMTTTAVSDPNDIWSTRLRRLSVSEALKLPKTFGRADIDWPECDECLLVGSGCWVCRFDSPWVEDIVWRLESRNILINGEWSHQRQSEDWLFSMDCHHKGLKVMATTAVKMYHGDPWFNNHSEWGTWSEDRTWRTLNWDGRQDIKDAADDLSRNGWKPPGDVEGWLASSEAVLLASTAKGKRVLEIGSYCGLSTICMAQTADSVVAVDPHHGVTGGAQPRDTFDELHANLAKYGIENVTVERMTSREFADTPAREPFDLVFIDGAHDYDSVKFDIGLALASLSEGGLLAFHDYRTDPRERCDHWDEGVQRAVDELLADGGELIDHCGTVAFVRPPAVVQEQREPAPLCSY